METLAHGRGRDFSPWLSHVLVLVLHFLDDPTLVSTLSSVFSPVLLNPPRFPRTNETSLFPSAPWLLAPALSMQQPMSTETLCCSVIVCCEFSVC